MFVQDFRYNPETFYMGSLVPGQAGVEERQFPGELGRCFDVGKAIGAEKIRGVFPGAVVDGDAEGKEVLVPGLEDSHAGIFHPVAPLVVVQVVGLAVGEDEQDTAGGGGRGTGAGQGAGRVGAWASRSEVGA